MPRSTTACPYRAGPRFSRRTSVPPACARTPRSPFCYLATLASNTRTYTPAPISNTFSGFVNLHNWYKNGPIFSAPMCISYKLFVFDRNVFEYTRPDVIVRVSFFLSFPSLKFRFLVIKFFLRFLEYLFRVFLLSEAELVRDELDDFFFHIFFVVIFFSVVFFVFFYFRSI